MTKGLQKYFPMIRTRMEELLSLILKQKVKIRKVLPNDSNRIADESFMHFQQTIYTG